MESANNARIGCKYPTILYGYLDSWLFCTVEKTRCLYFDSTYGLVKIRHNFSKYSAILHTKMFDEIYLFDRPKVASTEGVLFHSFARESTLMGMALRWIAPLGSYICNISHDVS